MVLIQSLSRSAPFPRVLGHHPGRTRPLFGVGEGHAAGRSVWSPAPRDRDASPAIHFLCLFLRVNELTHIPCPAWSGHCMCSGNVNQDVVYIPRTHCPMLIMTQLPPATRRNRDAIRFSALRPLCAEAILLGRLSKGPGPTRRGSWTRLGWNTCP